MISRRGPIKPTLVMDNLRFLFAFRTLPIKLKKRIPMVFSHTEAWTSQNII